MLFNIYADIYESNSSGRTVYLSIHSHNLSYGIPSSWRIAMYLWIIRYMHVVEDIHYVSVRDLLSIRHSFAYMRTQCHHYHLGLSARVIDVRETMIRDRYSIHTSAASYPEALSYFSCNSRRVHNTYPTLTYIHWRTKAEWNEMIMRRVHEFTGNETKPIYQRTNQLMPQKNKAYRKQFVQCRPRIGIGWGYLAP